MSAMTYATLKNAELARRLGISPEDARTLRLAEGTLSKWGELECGNSGLYASYAIERDETTGKPFRVTYPHNGDAVRRVAIADREAGALKRIAEVCRRNGLYFYHQTDPRGVALYVAREPLNDQNYSRAYAVGE